MKKLLTTLVMVSFAILSFGQLTPVPDFKNQPMLLKDGKLSKLEKQTVENKTKAKGMGYGGISNFILLSGASSPVVVGSAPTFIIKVDAEVDPESIIYLRKVSKANKKGREVEMSRISAFAAYGAKGKSVKKNDSGLEFTKVSDGVFSFTPVKPLEPGEYAFLNPEATAQALVYAFSVH